MPCAPALKIPAITFGVLAAALISGCSGHSLHHAQGSSGSCGVQSGCTAPAQSSTYEAFGSRYGGGAYQGCGAVEHACGYGVRWVAVPTYHQVYVPQLRPAPVAEPLPVPEMPAPEPIWAAPTPEPIYTPEIYTPEPPAYVPPTPAYYPEPEVYVPPAPIKRK